MPLTMKPVESSITIFLPDGSMFTPDVIVPKGMNRVSFTLNNIPVLKRIEVDYIINQCRATLNSPELTFTLNLQGRKDPARGVCWFEHDLLPEPFGLRVGENFNQVGIEGAGETGPGPQPFNFTPVAIGASVLIGLLIIGFIMGRK